jgi:hypothetical protein
MERRPSGDRFMRFVRASAAAMRRTFSPRSLAGPESEASHRVGMKRAFGPDVSPSKVLRRLATGGRALLAAMSFVVTCTAAAAPPADGISISSNPVVYGQPFTLTATLHQSASQVETGSFTFSIDSTVVSVVPVSDTGGLSTATFTVTTAAIIASLTNPIYLVGAHTITAAYAGDPVYAPFTYTATLTITGQPTTSQIATLDQTIYYGQEIGYDYGMDAILGAEAADPVESYGSLDGGTLDAYIDTKLACANTYGTGGRCPDPPFEGYSVGTYNTYVAYGGNQYYAASTSPYYAVTVIPDYTAATLGSSANPSFQFQPLQLTAAVTAMYQPVDPTTTTPTVVGTVQFFDGSTLIGTAALNAQGAATVSESTLLVGTHSLMACYGVSLNFRSSCSPVLTQVVTLPIVPENTVSLLTSSANPSVVGQAVTFAAVAETTGAIVQTPTGTVQFFDGTALLGTSTLDATGRAVLTTSALAPGVHPITAAYAANSVTAGSTSVVLQQAVLVALPPATGYMLLVDPTSVSIGVGSSVTVKVAVVVGSNTLGLPFELGCSQLPKEATCVFGQNSLPAGGGMTTLTISAAAPHACGSATPYFVASSRWRGMPWLAVVGIGLVLARKRGLMLGVVLLCGLGAGIAPVTGCGGCTDLGTQPFDYGMLVTATQGAAIATVHTSVSQAVKLQVHL